MNKYLLTISLLGSLISYAQVGIGTENPSATLHVKENRKVDDNVNNTNTTDGIMIPSVTKSELALKPANSYNSSTQEGIIVYINNIDGTITGPSSEMVDQINTVGFYYLTNDNKWLPIAKKGLDRSNDAWLNNSSKSRVELNTTSRGTIRPNSTEVVITDTGNLGINVTNPTKRLEVNLANGANEKDALRITNLKAENLQDRKLVIDNQGFVGTKLDESVAGKIQRFPIKKIESINGGETKAILIDPDTITDANTINTITPSFTPDTTKTGLRLPAGIYKLEVKIIGYFNEANVRNSLDVKIMVNGLEYSSQNYGSNTGINTDSTNYNGFTIMDLIELKEEAEIDFVIKNNINSFSVVDYITDSNKRIYGSLILVQRLK